MIEQCERHPLVAARAWWTRPRDVAAYCFLLEPGIVP